MRCERSSCSTARASSAALGERAEKELIGLYRELVPSKDLGVILTDW